MNTIIPIYEPDKKLSSVALNGLPSSSPIPIEALLNSSVFYPASELDADPIRILSPSIRSFVYCDYGVSRDQFDREFRRTGGFRGYRKTFEREVKTEDIFPRGWSPPLLPSPFDGNLGILARQQANCDLFGHWSIWKSTSDDRWFSFLFLSGEACALFQGLYSRLGISPIVLCMIQPGEAFGGNWTNLFEQDGFFHYAITRAGKNPPYLMLGGSHGHGYFKSCCWSGYSLLAKPQPQYTPSPEFHAFRFNKERNRGKLLRLWRSDSEPGAQPDAAR